MEAEVVKDAGDCACIPDVQLGVKVEGVQCVVCGESEGPYGVVERCCPLVWRQFPHPRSIAILAQHLLVLCPVLLIGVARNSNCAFWLQTQCLEIKVDDDVVAKRRTQVFAAAAVLLLVVSEIQVAPIGTLLKISEGPIGEYELVGGVAHLQIERSAHEHAGGTSAGEHKHDSCPPLNHVLQWHISGGDG